MKIKKLDIFLKNVMIVPIVNTCRENTYLKNVLTFMKVCAILRNIIE